MKNDSNFWYKTKIPSVVLHKILTIDIETEKTEKKISDLNWHFYWKSMSILCFATKTDPQCCCSAFLLIFPHFCNRRNVFFLWCTMRPPAACLWDYRLLIFSSIFLLLFALQMKAPKALILDQNSFLYPLHSDAKLVFCKKNHNFFF